MPHPVVHDSVFHPLDGVSIMAVIGTLLGYLPTATAVLTFIWTVIRLYETDTIQRIFCRKK